MNTERTEFQKEWVDGPALELAMVPVEKRCDKIIELGIAIEQMLEVEFPGLPEEKRLAAARFYTYDIIFRALEIAKATSGAVGSA